MFLFQFAVIKLGETQKNPQITTILNLKTEGRMAGINVASSLDYMQRPELGPETVLVS